MIASVNILSTQVSKPSFIRSVVKLVSALLLAAISLSATAAGLDVSVDRSQIYQNETVELRVVGSTEFELSFGTLFNLNSLNLPEPDTSPLLNDFEILDKNQQYNVRSINGDNKAEITWVYTLAPKRNGTLTIPPLKFKESDSRQINITVKPGTRNGDENEAPPVFLEVVVDKKSAYVNEQIILSMRLFHQGNLASGELSKPEPENAIIEQLGEQTKYTRMAHNQRYEVIERNYLVFPQKSGTLNIEPQSFTGTLIDPRARKRKFAREFSQAHAIEVKSAPQTFPSREWLPAMSMVLTEDWSDSTDEIRVGDSMTRTLSLQALGLLGSALPAFKLEEPTGFKIYPDQEKRNSEPHKAGVNSILTQSFAFVAVTPGMVTLPEIKIHWWDTVNDQQQTATLPARTINILPAPGSTSTPETITPPSNSVTQHTAPESEKVTSAGVWPYLFIISNVIWLIVVIFLIKKQQTSSYSKEKPSAPKEKQSLSEKSLIDAIAAGRKDSTALITKWVQDQQKVSANGENTQAAEIRYFYQVANLLGDEPELKSLFIKLESSLYGQEPTSLSNSEIENLQKALAIIKNQLNQSEPKTTDTLPPFYPKG